MSAAAATEACRAWGSLRGCRFGDSCKYAHEGDQGAAARKKAKESPEVCRGWASENGCRFENCPYKHEGPGKVAPPREKSDEACRAWKSERGCGRGAACRFRHEGDTGRLSAEERAARRAANPKPAVAAAKPATKAESGEEKKRRPRRRGAGRSAGAAASPSAASPNAKPKDDKPKICRFFKKPEGCKLGDACTFLHVSA